VTRSVTHLKLAGTYTRLAAIATVRARPRRGLVVTPIVAGARGRTTATALSSAQHRRLPRRPPRARRSDWLVHRPQVDFSACRDSLRVRSARRARPGGRANGQVRRSSSSAHAWARVAGAGGTAPAKNAAAAAPRGGCAARGPDTYPAMHTWGGHCKGRRHRQGWAAHGAGYRGNNTGCPGQPAAGRRVRGALFPVAPKRT